MNWNKWARQFHRWFSVAFTLTVIVAFAVSFAGVQEGEPAFILFYLPLLPLFLLIFTGLYLFLLPYITRRRSGRPTE